MADNIVFHVETAWKGNETEAGLATEGQTVAYQCLTSPSSPLGTTGIKPGSLLLSHLDFETTEEPGQTKGCITQCRTMGAEVRDQLHLEQVSEAWFWS